MPETMNQILVLLVFIVPGFIVIRVKRIAYPRAEEATLSIVLDSLALSSLVHAICFPIWYWIYASRSYATAPTLFVLQVFVILLLVPVLFGILFNFSVRTDKARWLREFLYFPHPDPTAWDYHFRKGRAYWIWLTFKNGQVMAGLFGPNSFAGSFPNRQDLYIEKLLSLDEHGKVKSLIENSAGALVRMDDLDRIEFFEIGGVKV
ncbi:MAG: DUF6338 family protein [Acidobacteriia bacterium]|nr:DUF6338 family protein [Terriglobia bacterium]